MIPLPGVDLDGLFAAARHKDRVAELLEGVLADIENVRLVIDDDDGFGPR